MPALSQPPRLLIGLSGNLHRAKPTAVLGTKLGSMLNENAYREVVNNAQRLIDGTECIPQGKTLEFILRKRYVETIKADRKSDLSLSKMRGLLKGNRAVVRGDCETTNEKTYDER